MSRGQPILFCKADGTRWARHCALVTKEAPPHIERNPRTLDAKGIRWANFGALMAGVRTASGVEDWRPAKPIRQAGGLQWKLARPVALLNAG